MGTRTTDGLLQLLPFSDSPRVTKRTTKGRFRTCFNAIPFLRTVIGHYMRKVIIALGIAALFLGEIRPARALDPASVNGARYIEESLAYENSATDHDPIVVKLQILLDRANFSPGMIDGRLGNNTIYALREFEKHSGQTVDGKLDSKVWQVLDGDLAEVLVPYILTDKDTKGPFVESVPEDYSAMADMDRLSYTSVEEMLSEKFHVDIELLKDLNPHAQFDRPGEKILVPNVDDIGLLREIESIKIDKGQGVLRGYDGAGNLVVVYPATIGSDDNPSPSGTMTVKGVARNPKYEYRPAKNFQQGGNEEPLTLPSGPNGPVGSIWIELSRDTYGIHGTAEPGLVGKSVSHGCVRLTNWDAQELGRLVKYGTKVSFVH